MIRSPLRPLIRILAARENGLNPDLIESEERVKRLTKKIILEKNRAGQRIALLMFMFTVAFSLIGIKMFVLASYVPPHLATGTKEDTLDNNRTQNAVRYHVVMDPAVTN